MPWATTSEVLAMTGATVDTAQLSYAQGVVDLFAGATETAPNVTARNRRLLKAAVAYQAAWMVAQVDVLSRLEVARVDQDGVSVQPGHDDALVLAPLARRALAQLSWVRRPTVTVEAGCTRYPNHEAYAQAWLRDRLPGDDCWRPS